MIKISHFASSSSSIIIIIIVKIIIAISVCTEHRLWLFITTCFCIGLHPNMFYILFLLSPITYFGILSLPLSHRLYFRIRVPLSILWINQAARWSVHFHAVRLLSYFSFRHDCVICFLCYRKKISFSFSGNTYLEFFFLHRSIMSRLTSWYRIYGVKQKNKLFTTHYLNDCATLAGIEKFSA